MGRNRTGADRERGRGASAKGAVETGTHVNTVSVKQVSKHTFTCDEHRCKRNGSLGRLRHDGTAQLLSCRPDASVGPLLIADPAHESGHGRARARADGQREEQTWATKFDEVARSGGAEEANQPQRAPAQGLASELGSESGLRSDAEYLHYTGGSFGHSLLILAVKL